jgi:hypothetical protein
MDISFNQLCSAIDYDWPVKAVAFALPIYNVGQIDKIIINAVIVYDFQSAAKDTTD